MTQEKKTTEAERGDTRPQDQEAGDHSAPRTPNERDTSADSQSDGQAADNPRNKAAAQDAASGRPDTGKAPEMDRVYNEQVREGAPKSGTGR